MIQPEPQAPFSDASFSIVRIRNVLKYFKMDGQPNIGRNYCFEVHMGIARGRDIVWYVIPESAPNLTPEGIFKWKGRYCYYSDELGELTFFNGARIALFKESEV